MSKDSERGYVKVNIPCLLNMRKLLFLGCYYFCGLVCLCNMLLMHPWFNGKTHPTITELMSWQTVFLGASKTCAAVYVCLLSCWVVVSGAHKQTSWSSFSCLLIYLVLVLLRSVSRFCLLLCQLYEKLLFKVDRPHAFVCLHSRFDYFCLYCTTLYGFIHESLIWITASRKFYKFLRIFQKCISGVRKYRSLPALLSLGCF